jgi:hypothetical protein
MPQNGIRRNDACPCGSGNKFKKCHGRDPNSTLVPEIKRMLAVDEHPVRWVITNRAATSFFADKQGRMLVFPDRDTARQIALLDLFTDQTPNEIYVAPLGVNSWKSVQDSMPFVDVPNLETGIALVEERVLDQRARLGYEYAEETGEEVDADS